MSPDQETSVTATPRQPRRTQHHRIL